MGISTAFSTYGNFVFGNGSELIGNAIKAQRATGASIPKAVYKGFKTGIKSSYQAQVAGGGFFKSMWSAIKNIPSSVSSASGIGGKIKALGKGLGKLSPGIFAAMMIIPEIPNVVKATKEQGIGQGLKEVGKAATKLTLGSVGAALGSLIPIPFVGSALGYMAGSALGSLITGKSYTEQQEEAAANGTDTTATQTTDQTGQTSATGSTYQPTTTAMDFPPVEANFFDGRLAGGHLSYANYSGNRPTVGSRLNIVSQ